MSILEWHAWPSTSDNILHNTYPEFESSSSSVFQITEKTVRSIIISYRLHQVEGGHDFTQFQSVIVGLRYVRITAVIVGLHYVRIISSDVLCLHNLVCYMCSIKVGKPCIILNMFLILIICTGK